MVLIWMVLKFCRPAKSLTVEDYTNIIIFDGLMALNGISMLDDNNTAVGITEKDRTARM